MFNFKWQPTSSGIRYERLGAPKPKPGEGYGIGNNMTSFNATMGGNAQTSQGEAPTISDLNSRQMVNHLEKHQLITEKYNLLIQLQKYGDTHKENCFDVTPITFYVDIPDF